MIFAKSFTFILLILESVAFSKISRFDLTFNKNYVDSICNVMDLNKNIKYNKTNDLIISRYNNDKSLCFNFNFNINLNSSKSTILFRNKYNYLIKQTDYYNVDNTFQYLIYIKSRPINYNTTKWDVMVRHNIDYVNEYFVTQIIKDWISKQINKTPKLLHPELFKFFYK
jgi:hypothetical protein